MCVVCNLAAFRYMNRWIASSDNKNERQHEPSKNDDKEKTRE